MANNKIAIRPLAERFWLKVNKDGPIHPYRPELGKCWLWTAGTDKAGYGKIGGELPKRRTLRANRVSWEIHFGPIPVGKYACHSCDNVLCVNPGHLCLGDSQSNMTDRLVRGRAPRGSQLPQARLTESQAKRIKETRGKERFGASAATVSNILKGKQWTHV